MKGGSCDVSAIETFGEVFYKEVAVQVLQCSNWMLSNTVLDSTLFPLCWVQNTPIIRVYTFKYPNELCWKRTWYSFMFKLSITARLKRLSKPLTWLNFSGFFCFLNNNRYESLAIWMGYQGIGAQKQIRMLLGDLSTTEVALYQKHCSREWFSFNNV